MSEQQPQNAPPASSGVTAGTSRREVLIIRSWPKIILMLPTLFMSLICGVAMLVHDNTQEVNQFGTVHVWGIVFLAVLAINLTMLLYDLNLRGFIVVALLIIVLFLVMVLLNNQENLWKILGKVFSVRVFANSAFYFTFAVVLLFNLAIAWVITRFNYWRVEHNEIIIHRGFMHEQERHPTAHARFKLVIEDIVEYGLLGCGTLVFTFSDDQTTHELRTVLFAHSKAKKLDELLGRIAVVAH